MTQNLKIHEAVIYLLNSVPNGMTAIQLADAIEEQQLSRKANGEFPTAEDINRRVSGATYKNDVFIKKDGIIRHNPITEKRLFRVTFNTTEWTSPIEHTSKKANQDKRVAFENQYGFGFEEWLFNDAFFLDGYHYGAIRGAEDLKNLYRIVREAYLYTINQKTHERFLVGKIDNLELISSYSVQRKIAQILFDRAQPTMQKDLERIDADLSGLKQLDHFCVRFRPEDAFMFPKMIPTEELSSKEFLRFMPYKVEGKLEDFLAKRIPKDQFKFREGRAKPGGSSERTLTDRTYSVEAPHVKIIDNLELFLKSDHNPFQGKLGIEHCKFGWHTADIVVAHDDGSYTIFEVKTSVNIRLNVREGLGQLLDYACWYPSIKIRGLVLVSPQKMKGSNIDYFKRIQQNISMETHYWQFDDENSTFVF